ncbi:TraR/DksA C4-type zinc finger protein [uncultured Desulfuromusa sp.]|uniref:TraR/DksA C4-type zinc finger protein n=1 Tax=uncultured Desulfuromusa sp. TaxID=219183 RepID=UPI002AA89D93|nr:TraR/DksA C4-type zinc finger protein [uncultured Desulfuromusa sp.]
MADDADRAQVINDQFQADMLAQAQQNNSTGISNRFCENCEEPIPEGRRKAQKGCKLCVSCQQEQEQEQKELLSHWRTI